MLTRFIARHWRSLLVGPLATLTILLGCASPAKGTPPQDSTVELSALESHFKSIAEKVSPAVVAISASTVADDSPSACRTKELSNDKLQTFLSKTTRMVGTGFIIDSNGYILTNDHVIDDAQQLWITTDDQKVYPAIVIGTDPRSDLAILKIPGKYLPTVQMGDGSAVRRGQWSIAIGNPFGLSGSGEMCVSVGVISATNRSLPKLSETENRLYNDLIQTTAQINPGNSGGPLFDLQGKVIGINTAVIMPQKSTNGIGFAMPICPQLLDKVNQLKQGNEVVYSYLGVIAENPSDLDRETAGLTKSIGVCIESIQPDSPAANGVLRKGDIICSVNNHPILDSDNFAAIIGNSPINHPIPIEFTRDGNSHRLQLTLQKRQLPIAAITRSTQRMHWSGMILGPAETNGLSNGLLVLNIDPSSPFVKRGFHEGTIIHSIAGKTVNAIPDLQQIVNDTPFDRCSFTTEPDSATATATAELPMGR